MQKVQVSKNYNRQWTNLNKKINSPSHFSGIFTNRNRIIYDEVTGAEKRILPFFPVKTT